MDGNAPSPREFNNQQTPCSNFARCAVEIPPCTNRLHASPAGTELLVVGYLLLPAEMVPQSFFPLSVRMGMGRKRGNRIMVTVKMRQVDIACDELSAENGW
jgi:hypothetical protein